MADVVKVTKVEYFEMIKNVVLDSEIENADELVAFIDKQVEMIENKATKQKEKAAEKKAATDALKAQVADALTSDFQTADAIAEVVGESKAKVVSRLTALVKDGVAAKEQTKVDDKKVMAYRLA